MRNDGFTDGLRVLVVVVVDAVPGTLTRVTVLTGYFDEGLSSSSGSRLTGRLITRTRAVGRINPANGENASGSSVVDTKDIRGVFGLSVVVEVVVVVVVDVVVLLLSSSTTTGRVVVMTSSSAKDAGLILFPLEGL